MGWVWFSRGLGVCDFSSMRYMVWLWFGPVLGLGSPQVRMWSPWANTACWALGDPCGPETENMSPGSSAPDPAHLGVLAG